MKIISESNIKYLSSDDKAMLINALLIYGCISGKNVYNEIIQLRSSSRDNPISLETRTKIDEQIKDLLVLSHDYLVNLTPQNDDERFDLMLNSKNMLSKKYLDDLKSLDLVQLQTLPFSRKLIIYATQPLSSFEELVKKWGFENLSKYFDYTGNIQPGVGQLD